jgi:hypothetical protein
MCVWPQRTLSAAEPDGRTAAYLRQNRMAAPHAICGMSGRSVLTVKVPDSGFPILRVSCIATRAVVPDSFVAVAGPSVGLLQDRQLLCAGHVQEVAAGGVVTLIRAA